MPGLIDIRRRIRSVRNTQQITKAMKMVASARLRRAQDAVLATRPYAQEIRKVIGNLAARAGDSRHPLLERREEKRVLLAVVTGDKGLCGAFNQNVIRQAEQALKRWPEAELLLLGKKGNDYFGRRGYRLRGAYTNLFAGVTVERAIEIAKEIEEAYASRQIDAVYMIFNQFRSILQQKLTEQLLLPMERPESEEPAPGVDYLYEPSAAEILGDLLPRYLADQVYQVLLESQAAEHAARMTAMDSATKNAGEMIDHLTLTYNRARQAAITKELIEIVSGAQALEL